MMTKMSTPIWQRLICGLLAAAGVMAMTGNLLDGSVRGLWQFAIWVFGAFGVVAFGRIAFQKVAVCRDVDAMPVPSPRVGHLVDAHRQVEAIKAYRAQTAASLFEARAVIAHYWPDNAPKRIREK